ncbi:MAG: hypothetical protein AAGA66_00930 [Bacteroidota bacterium]
MKIIPMTDHILSPNPKGEKPASSSLKFFLLVTSVVVLLLLFGSDAHAQTDSKEVTTVTQEKELAELKQALTAELAAMRKEGYCFSYKIFIRQISYSNPNS